MSGRDPKPRDQEAGGEPFLQRWARLKSESREAEATGSADAVSPSPRTTSTDPLEAGTPAVATDRVLPDLALLDQDSDYSAFLAPEVDPLLRRAALRKLFHSPKFNVCDGLDDYCGDYTQFAPLGGIVTADMRHHVERAAKELLADHESPDTKSPVAASGTAVAANAPETEPGAPSDEEEEHHDDRGPA
jgi:hypothetical protein